MRVLVVNSDNSGRTIEINDEQARQWRSKFSQIAMIELGHAVGSPLVSQDLIYGMELACYYSEEKDAGKYNKSVSYFLGEPVYGNVIFSKVVKDKDGYGLTSLTKSDVNRIQEEMCVSPINLWENRKDA